MASLAPQDKAYLVRQKQEIIDSCKQCTGLSLTCECYADYFLELAKVTASIPIKYRDFNLSKIDTPDATPLVQSIRKYLNNIRTFKEKGRGIYLWGNTGNAKTALSCVILMEALRQGYTAYFTDLSKCMDLITDGWHDDESKADFTRRILNSDFLVIDDVGKEYKSKTGFLEAHFDQIFRERANNLLPTVLTSNLAPTDIATDYGKRLFSILNEHLLVIETNMSDYRRKVLAPKNEQAIKQSKAESKKTSQAS